MGSGDNKSERSWVLVQSSHWTKTKDIWSARTWRTYSAEGSDKHHPNQVDMWRRKWDLVAESDDLAELKALGKLLEGR